MSGSGRAHGPRWRRRAAGWAVVGMVVAAALASAPSHAAVAVPIRLTAAVTPDLSPEEQQLVSVMDPEDRARYLLQKRMADEARMAALLAEVLAERHETAMSVIDNIR
jgi:hypothetical protein